MRAPRSERAASSSMSRGPASDRLRGGKPAKSAGKSAARIAGRADRETWQAYHRAAPLSLLPPDLLVRDRR